MKTTYPEMVQVGIKMDKRALKFFKMLAAARDLNLGEMLGEILADEAIAFNHNYGIDMDKESIEKLKEVAGFPTN